MSTEDNHCVELEIDHPPRDAGNVQPEPVRNFPPQTRSRTRLASYRYPSPYCPGDDEDGGLLYDSYGVPMRPGEDLGNSSNQASGTSRDKPNRRMAIHTSRTATSRAPKDGTRLCPRGKQAVSDRLLVLMDHQLQLRMQQRCSTSGCHYPLRERLSSTSTTTHRTTRPRARISPRAIIPAIYDRDVFTPARLSAAGGGAPLYVFYDGFD
jgi:hypothetical protein